MNRPIRVYVDTSVFGGVFDKEFEKGSRDFFGRVHTGEFVIVVSSAVFDELLEAPEPVRDHYLELAPHLEVAQINSAAYELQAAYLASKVVSLRWAADALHVAVATVSNCRAIVSWNFRHIVNFRRIPLYNGVNMAHGYTAIAIHTPQEVIEYDE